MVSSLLTGATLTAHAQSWNLTTGGSWATATNWNPAAVPNAVGATVLFPNTNTANRTITNDSGATGFTVGSIAFDLTGTGTFTNSLTTGTPNTSNLKLDNGGNGVTITTTGDGTGNNTISVPLILNDNLTGVVNQTTSTSIAGSLNLTATMSGTGGFTKQGDGLATFGTGLKTYTGATVVSGGRMRMSSTSQPSATSSFTINSGGQLNLINGAGGSSYTFGAGPLNLNGSGPTTGPYAVFPGAIRNDTGLDVTITNAVVLQSNTTLHVQATAGTGSSASPTGSLTFSGNVSGTGGLTLTAPNSNIDQGSLVLTGTNSYSGGTTVSGGILVAGASSVNAFGTGNVTVSNAASTASIARATISTGATNAIGDTATLSLAGGGTAGTADQGFITLATGVNETVGGLILGGVNQTVAGTYGATGSGAAIINDEYFAGTGVITLTPVPEPTGVLLAAGATLGAAGLIRKRRAARAN